jgi:hypothetical protein
MKHLFGTQWRADDGAILTINTYGLCAWHERRDTDWTWVGMLKDSDAAQGTIEFVTYHPDGQMVTATDVTMIQQDNHLRVDFNYIWPGVLGAIKGHRVFNRVVEPKAA